MAFTHLHVHTQYSLLQGAIHLDALFARVKAYGMSAVAMTDSHNLFGAIDFYLSAKKAGVKPIIGCEVTYAPFGRSWGASTGGQKPTPLHHLVLLCKNQRGYQNLCRMVSQSYLDMPPPQKGFSGTPKALVTREMLARFGSDLFVLSGCLRGEIPTHILNAEEDAALESLQWFKERFGSNFYLELQDAPLPEQQHVNEILSQWGERYGVGCVATTDCHYLESQDAEAHELLQCIEQGKNLDLGRPTSLVPPDYDFKSEATIRERFGRYAAACDATQTIADQCELEFRFKDDQGRPIYHLPRFRPTGVGPHDPFDLHRYFWEQAEAGLDRRLARAPQLDREIYQARLRDELSMIEKTGFAGYFLIVADFINWAKNQQIPVGPGRGSGAGSLVAYSLNITDIDPIQYQLLFERFINPERISMPDFDVDFCQDRRGEVIDYVSRKYGADNVCQIITFGKLQARAVIRDVGRVLGLSFGETDQITKLLPEELDLTLARALEKEPRLRQKMAAEPKVNQVVRYAQALEGLYRSTGIHAAGVIITEEPVVNYCPIFIGREGARVTQFDKDFAEAIGLVKFDFLGLKTLTVIDNAVKLLKSGPAAGSREQAFVLADIDYADPCVYRLISLGDTDGVFQVESSGMKDLCTRIQPSSLEDITAINALYRPGPLGSGMVDDFIERKHGRKIITYEVEALAPILKDTYGVILYQEQVMQIARELAGYSLGQADLLRRAMGKKKAEEMAEHRAIFVRGATAKGLPATQAEGIFDLMAKFAEYGFNKSHSAAYGMLTYQTAYLKTHYPAEFLAALMTTEMDNTEKITKYIGDARRHQIPILSPDVNLSQRRFSVELVEGSPQRGIRFGLEAIKGVGGIAVDTILEARKQKPFKGVVDFARRSSTRKVNKKVLEALCLSGALDSIAELNRASLLASLEAILEHAGDEQAEKERGQSSLFDAFADDQIKLYQPESTLFKKEPDWPSARKLAREKEVVGFYISGHPMDPWQAICERWLKWSTDQIKLVSVQKSEARKLQPADANGYDDHYAHIRPAKTEVRLAGLFVEFKEVTTKKGGKMAFAQIEDQLGKLEVIFFPDAYHALQESLRQWMDQGEIVLVTGEIEFNDEAPKILAKNLELLAEAHESRIKKLRLRLAVPELTSEKLRDLKRYLLEGRGKCGVELLFEDAQFQVTLSLPKSWGVSSTPALIRQINQIFGREVVLLQ